jgi:hypothetical protein
VNTKTVLQHQAALPDSWDPLSADKGFRVADPNIGSLDDHHIELLFRELTEEARIILAARCSGPPTSTLAGEHW